MNVLVKIKEQQFYCGSISELLEFSSTNKCAVIIDEKNLTELLSKEVNYSIDHINQIIIISETLNTVLPEFSGKSVFLIAAMGLEQAIGLAFHSEDLNTNIFCVLDIEKTEIKKMIESVVV